MHVVCTVSQHHIPGAGMRYRLFRTWSRLSCRCLRHGVVHMICEPYVPFAYKVPVPVRAQACVYVKIPLGWLLLLCSLPSGCNPGVGRRPAQACGTEPCEASVLYGNHPHRHHEHVPCEASARMQARCYLSLDQLTCATPGTRCGAGLLLASPSCLRSYLTAVVSAVALL